MLLNDLKLYVILFLECWLLNELYINYIVDLCVLEINKKRLYELDGK